MTHFPGPSAEDPLAERLRAALHAQADTARPSPDGLDRIRERVGTRTARPGWSPWARGLVAVGSAAAVAAVAVGGWSLAGHGKGDDIGTAVARTTTTAPAASSVSSPSPTPSTSAPAVTSGGPKHAVAVYYLGQSDALYREWRTVSAGAPVPAALNQLTGGRPTDADYRSGWSGYTATYTPGPTPTVTLAGPPVSPSTAALQEVVYTVTAADPAVKTISLTYPTGSSTKTVVLTRAPSYLTLGAVWVDLTDGQTVARTFRFGGQATAFEAVVSWRVLKGTAVVKHGSAQASIGAPQRGTWSVSLSLPPGSYTVEGYITSAENGSMQAVDSKRVVVR